eukprot:365776-Chlamydomonas_euryale.AAC.21
MEVVDVAKQMAVHHRRTLAMWLADNQLGAYLKRSKVSDSQRALPCNVTLIPPPSAARAMQKGRAESLEVSINAATSDWHSTHSQRCARGTAISGGGMKALVICMLDCAFKPEVLATRCGRCSSAPAMVACFFPSSPVGCRVWYARKVDAWTLDMRARCSTFRTSAGMAARQWQQLYVDTYACTVGRWMQGRDVEAALTSAFSAKRSAAAVAAAEAPLCDVVPKSIRQWQWRGWQWHSCSRWQSKASSQAFATFTVSRMAPALMAYQSSLHSLTCACSNLLCTLSLYLCMSSWLRTWPAATSKMLHNVFECQFLILWERFLDKNLNMLPRQVADWSTCWLVGGVVHHTSYLVRYVTLDTTLLRAQHVQWARQQNNC